MCHAVYANKFHLILIRTWLKVQLRLVYSRAQTSPEVQKRGINGPTKRTYVINQNIYHLNYKQDTWRFRFYSDCATMTSWWCHSVVLILELVQETLFLWRVLLYCFHCDRISFKCADSLQAVLWKFKLNNWIWYDILLLTLSKHKVGIQMKTLPYYHHFQSQNKIKIYILDWVDKRIIY